MREWLSLSVWVGAFLAFELPAQDVFGIWPWYSLSKTVQVGEAWWWPIPVYVLIFTSVLLGHLEFDWHVRWLILVALIGVLLIASHLIGRYA